jgi:PTS system ascorbate-specific IIA component
MALILIVAHAPLASALQVLAGHAYAERAQQVVAVDVAPGAQLADATAQVNEVLLAHAGSEVLVLTDAFGATPCNAALAAVDGQRSRVVAGVNLPMLWRSLCYGELPLAELVGRAADGGRQGIMQIASPRRQNQQNWPCGDDPDTNPDQ